jgi:predicted acyl esterase
LERSLKTDPPREERAATTYRFDPARPVPSIGGNVSSLADNTLFHERGRESRVVLPVIPIESIPR